MALLRGFHSVEEDVVLYGERVFLRYPQFSDFEIWSEMRSESRNFLEPWEPTWAADDLTRPAFRRRLQRYSRDIREGRAFPFFIFDTERKQLLGGVTLSNVRRGVTQACSMGYWIAERYKGRGYMTAAVRAILSFVFDDLRLNRLEAACIPGNLASIRVLRKVGFTEEGYARCYLKINGAWRDHILFAFVEGDLDLRD